MRRVKTIYCIVVISIALILASVGGLLGIITAIIVLAGALPMFRAVGRAAEQRGVTDYRRLRQAAARRILSTDQTAPDVREVDR